MNEILFKGWSITLEQLEAMIMLCRQAKKKELGFGVGCLDGKKVKEFIDPKRPGNYNYGKYKLYVKGCSFTMTVSTLSFPIVSDAIFDEFPPIPPEPIKDPGGG
ncbi:MAG: hypothetical protein MUF59_09945 [Candidatus Krumholzibacteria bacterium]|nr:hypothetical protein [Candidatus Krumholzibacteria bacterium]